mgnify:FL=1
MAIKTIDAKTLLYNILACHSSVIMEDLSVMLAKIDEKFTRRCPGYYLETSRVYATIYNNPLIFKRDDRRVYVGDDETKQLFSPKFINTINSSLEQKVAKTLQEVIAEIR